jgi:hypothetical protein
MAYFTEDDRFEFDAPYDYVREAYGDPCPVHGTLRGGGDCPECLSAWEPADDIIEFEAPQPVQAAQPIIDDDIPF